MFDGGTLKDSGMNFAPAEPLKYADKAKPYEASEFAEFIKELHNDCKQRHIEERREIAEQGRLMAALRAGKLEIRRDPKFGSFALLKPLPHKPKEDRHIYPLAQVNSSQLTAIIRGSQPRITPKFFGNTAKADIQHGLLQQIIDHYQSEFYDDDFKQRKSLSAMDYGTIAIRVAYDDKLNQISSVKPIVEDTDKVISEGYGFCKKCGYEGVPDDFGSIDIAPQCPECKSYNVSDLVPPQIVKSAEIVGVEEIHQGDIYLALEDIPALNWDMRKYTQDSPYVQKAFEVSKRLIESMTGLNIQEGDTDEDFGLRIINELGNKGGSTEDWGRDKIYGNFEHLKGTAIGYEEWYKPEMYVGQRFTKDQKTISGETISKNVPLEKTFPEGLCVLGFNDMSLIVGAWNESCRIFSGVYHIQSHSGVGKGTTDAVEISEQLNSAHSAALAVIKRYGAGGGHIYDEKVLTKTEAQKLLKPGGLVGANMKGGRYTSVDAAIKQVATGEISQSNLTYIAQLSNMLNMSFQTTDFTQGVADSRVDVNTLGGQQLLYSQNLQRSSAPLSMLAYLDTIVFGEVVHCFRKYIKIPKFFGRTDKFALTKGRFISADDIPEKVKCDFVQDSELPTNEFTKQDALGRMLEKSQYWGVPFGQLAMSEPRLAAWYANIFGVELPIFNYSELIMRCQDRIDQIKTLAEDEMLIAQMAGMNPNDPRLGEAIVDKLSPPLDVFEENHVIKAQVLSEYLDNDEVKEWSPLVQMSLRALISRHYKLQRDFKFGLQTLDAEGQMKLQAMMAGFQNQLAAPQTETEMLGEGANRIADEVAKEEDFSREQEVAKLDHARAIELESLKQTAKKENYA